MAVLMEERTRGSCALDTRPWGTITPEQFRQDEGRHWSPLAWLSLAGEVVFGLVLTLLGLLTSVALVASLIAAPFIAVSLTVFLFALAIWAAPVVIPVLLGLFLLALAVEVMGW